MLRCNDLLAVMFDDLVHPNGKVRTRLPFWQQKTKDGVVPVLTPMAKKACQLWIKQSGKKSGDYLFTGQRLGRKDPIKDGNFRLRVKEWARWLGLDDRFYSTHTLRKTKPTFLFQWCGVAIEDISNMLGHKNPASTMHYLGLNTDRAQEIALKYDIFDPKYGRQRNPQAFDPIGVCQWQGL